MNIKYIVTPISLLVMNENNIIIKVNIKWLVNIVFIVTTIRRPTPVKLPRSDKFDKSGCRVTVVSVKLAEVLISSKFTPIKA